MRVSRSRCTHCRVMFCRPSGAEMEGGKGPPRGVSPRSVNTLDIPQSQTRRAAECNLLVDNLRYRWFLVLCASVAVPRSPCSPSDGPRLRPGSPYRIPPTNPPASRSYTSHPPTAPSVATGVRPTLAQHMRGGRPVVVRDLCRFRPVISFPRRSHVRRRSPSP